MFIEKVKEIYNSLTSKQKSIVIFVGVFVVLVIITGIIG